jgi:DNA ligase 1
MSPLIEVRHRRGIHLPEANLWLDPRFGVERAFVSHAHADHFARHQLSLGSEVTRELVRTRFGAQGEFQALPLRQSQPWEDWQLRLLPAGHIPGSALLHLTRQTDGASLLYTGDFKLRHGLSAEPCELARADTLVMECTFGLPQYRFPPREQTIAAVLQWVRETLEDGAIPVLLGYALGKAQEILRLLAGTGHPVMLHKAVFEMTQALAPQLGPLPDFELFDPARAPGHVLIFPPGTQRSLALRRLKTCRTALLSGWALQPGARYRYQVDEAFPLSDHADYDELLAAVDAVQPRQVWLVHGPTREFAADLRARGWQAWSLEQADQLELFRLASAAQPVAANFEPVPPPQAADGFAAWSAVAAATAAEASRLKKTALLADYLRGLADTDLPLAVRYFAGLHFDPAAGEAPLNAGWAIIRRALQDLTRLGEAEFRAVSRSQADAGRTAFLLLGQRAQLATAGPALTLAGTDAFLRALRAAGGPAAKTALLRDTLAGLDAISGSWLVRLLTGELRMGSKEGLVEEAVATAFDQEAEAVREAAMLTGDLGQAARLARAGRLQEAAPRLFVPVKVMLASPEESAEAIWQRLAGEDPPTERPPDAASRCVWLEDKFDGIRAQLHAGPDRAELFSRDLKPVGAQFPELLAAAAHLDASVILDGELIAESADRRLSFFDLQKRLGRRDQGDLFLPSDIRVRYVAFDLLWQDGVSLLDRPLQERRAALEALALPEPLGRIEVLQADCAEAIETAFHAARRRGNEGLIAKDAQSAYRPGRRGKAWLKLKKAFATLDVVVVKAEQGHGKRSQVLSDYTFALRDETGALRVIGKAYSGLTDAEIEELTAHFTANTLDQRGRVRTVVPDTVLEIAFDSIQPSRRHDSGLALRFPRIKAWRRDKGPEEIDDLAYARRLAGVEAPTA